MLPLDTTTPSPSRQRTDSATERHAFTAPRSPTVGRALLTVVERRRTADASMVDPGRSSGAAAFSAALDRARHPRSTGDAGGPRACSSVARPDRVAAIEDAIAAIDAGRIDAARELLVAFVAAVR